MLTEQLYYAIATEIGQKIRAQRKHLGLTQAELGKLLNYSQSAIADYENGVTAPNVVTLRMLAIALQCHPADLI